MRVHSSTKLVTALLLMSAGLFGLGQAPSKGSAQPSPDIRTALGFIAAGMEHYSRFKGPDGDEQESSSSLAYDLLQNPTHGAAIIFRQVRSMGNCTYKKTSVVALEALDPTQLHILDEPWGVMLRVETTNGNKAIAVTQSAESRIENNTCAAWEPRWDNKLFLRFDDKSYRDRARKAMQYAIELAGGKASDF